MIAKTIETTKAAFYSALSILVYFVLFVLMFILVYIFSDVPSFLSYFVLLLYGVLLEEIPKYRQRFLDSPDVKPRTKYVTFFFASNLKGFLSVTVKDAAILGAGILISFLFFGLIMTEMSMMLGAFLFLLFIFFLLKRITKENYIFFVIFFIFFTPIAYIAYRDLGNEGLTMLYAFLTLINSALMLNMSRENPYVRFLSKVLRD